MMIPTIVLTAAIANNQVEGFSSQAGAWFRSSPTHVIPSEWGRISQRFEVTFDALKRDAASNRIEKMTKFSHHLAISRGEDQIFLAYLAARYLNLYLKESRSTNLDGKLAIGIINSEGLTYQPFVLECYKAASLTTNPQRWGSLGRNLIREYPQDRQLKEALVFDGMYGALGESDLLYAKKLNGTEFKEKSSETRLRRNANLTYKLFRQTKKDDYRKEAIELYTELKRVASDNDT
ncbi:hypothetical protein IQ258_29660, partial [Coleofasciculus sp. LEGE 07081]|uniref:hypothetical protein n=1 Tax=Coleofasciculus sp. LEGE 07081 TaxID=2777967 RepID=UPI0018807B16